jgi:hypothetical protein
MRGGSPVKTKFNLGAAVTADSQPGNWAGTTTPVNANPSVPAGPGDSRPCDSADAAAPSLSSVGITPAMLWSDEPVIVKLTCGRSVSTLKKESRKGLTMYRRGEGTRCRFFWLTSEVVAYYRVTSQSNNRSTKQEAIQ